jgi:hypothetical protein
MRGAELDICQLLYRYAEAIDGSRLEDAAALVRHARIETGVGGTRDVDHRRSRRHRPGAVGAC